MLIYLTYTALLAGLAFMPQVLDRVFTAGLFKGLANEMSNREHPLAASAFGERAGRAAANWAQFFPPFAVLALIAATLHPSSATAATIALVFFVARLAFTVLYWLGVPVLRTAAFYTGVGATVAMGLLDLGLIA